MYHYAGNNPVRYIDPDGRSPKEYEVAKLLGNTSQAKGVNLNLFPAEHPNDIIVTTKTGKHIYMRTAAAGIVRYSALYYVGAHGSRRSVLSFGEDGLQKDPVRLTPKKLAEMIKNDKDYHNQPVVLLVCNTGEDPENKCNAVDSFAQQLADCLGEGSVVIASIGYCEYDSYINEVIFNGKPRSKRGYDVNPREQYIFRGKTNEE